MIQQPSTDVRVAAQVRQSKPKVAYVIEPRFPGGTSSAIAAELEAIAPLADVEVHGLKTAMFTDQAVAPQLRDVLRRLGLPLKMDSREISADTIIFHNPSCLRFQDDAAIRLFACHLIVVTHENFLRPGGAPAFDVAKCLQIIASNALALRRSLAPVSGHNRSTVHAWLQAQGHTDAWELLETNWFNICAFAMQAPTAQPKDRRGRLSRPGFEKFPSRDVMEMCFPKSAECNVILGADHLLQSHDAPAHWTLHPFGALTVDNFFRGIDFFVYYTAPTWRESFGRVIAEAIAAGKIAITDEETAESFDGAACSAPPEAVTGIIADYLADPARYASDVRRSQDQLAARSQTAFQEMADPVLQAASDARR